MKKKNRNRTILEQFQNPIEQSLRVIKLIHLTIRYLPAQHNLGHSSTHQQGKQNKKCLKTKLLS